MMDWNYNSKGKGKKEKEGEKEREDMATDHSCEQEQLTASKGKPIHRKLWTAFYVR